MSRVALKISRSGLVDPGLGSAEVDSSPIMAAGKSIIITTFRGCAPAIGDGIDAVTLLLWGPTVADPSTIEIAVGCMQYDYNLEETLVGDGTKKLFLVRLVPSNSSQRRIFSQVRGFRET